MEFYSFKLKKVYGCFELKYVTLLLVLIQCAWTEDAFPSVDVTCNSTGLYVKIAFSEPFKGTVYAKGHRFDPLCSKTESSALDGFLFLPAAACGTRVQEVDDTENTWLTNTIVIQQHPLIRTENDFQKPVTCLLPDAINNFCNYASKYERMYKSHSLPQTSSSDMIHNSSSKIFNNELTHFVVFELLDSTNYEDVEIKGCIAHNTTVQVKNSLIHEITKIDGCTTIYSRNSSLGIISAKGFITAYVEVKNPEMESSNSFYLTCEVIFCKTECRYSEIDLQTEHSNAVINHKLTKRSTDTSSEMVSLKQYEARTRFLKSTVKALMDRIMEQRKSNGQPKIRKRLMRLDDSSFPLKPNSFESRVIASTEIFSPESVSEDFNEMEPHLEDDYDHDDYHPNDFRRDIDFNDYQPDHEDETSPITEISTVDSDIDVVTLPKGFNDDANETLSEEELQGKGTEVNSDDVASSVNEVKENNTDTSTSTVVPPVVEVSSDHLGSCVPKVRFVIVLIVMGFVTGSLILVTCGLGLYIRKEKKRNRLNDFLLYSIGF